MGEGRGAPRGMAAAGRQGSLPDRCGGVRRHPDGAGVELEFGAAPWELRAAAAQKGSEAQERAEAGHAAGGCGWRCADRPIWDLMTQIAAAARVSLVGWWRRGG